MTAEIDEQTVNSGKDARSVVRNSIASIAGQMANLLVGLISSVYVARILGAEQFGILNWALGLCTMAIAIANAGLDQVVVREVARKTAKAGEILLSSFLVKIFTSAICYSVILAYLHYRHCTGAKLAVGYLLGSTVIAESLNASVRAVFVGFEKQAIPAAVSIITNVIRVAAAIALVHNGYDVVAVAWVSVVIVVLTLAVHLAVLRKVTSAAWWPTLATAKSLVAVGSTFMVTDILMKVFDRADYVMLEIYKGVAAVGVYGAAYRAIEIVSMIGFSCSLSLFPIVSRRLQESEEHHRRALERTTKFLVILGLPLCIGVFLLSEQLMTGLYTSKFSGAGHCLAILIWSRIAAFAILPGQQSVAARNAQIWLFPPVIARVVVNILLNLYLIPRYGYVGACWAMVVSENLHYLLSYLIAFRAAERFNPVTLFAKPVLATVVMAGIIVILRPYTIAIPIMGGVVSYAAAILVLRAFDADDIRTLRSLRRG